MAACCLQFPMKVDYGASQHFCDDPVCPDPVRQPSIGKGQMGSALMGSTSWVLPLTYFNLPRSARAYLFPPICRNSLLFSAAPLVLTPLVRNGIPPSSESHGPCRPPPAPGPAHPPAVARCRLLVLGLYGIPCRTIHFMAIVIPKPWLEPGQCLTQGSADSLLVLGR